MTAIRGRVTTKSKFRPRDGRFVQYTRTSPGPCLTYWQQRSLSSLNHLLAKVPATPKKLEVNCHARNHEHEFLLHSSSADALLHQLALEPQVSVQSWAITAEDRQKPLTLCSMQSTSDPPYHEMDNLMNKVGSSGTGSKSHHNLSPTMAGPNPGKSSSKKRLSSKAAGFVKTPEKERHSSHQRLMPYSWHQSPLIRPPFPPHLSATAMPFASRSVYGSPVPSRIHYSSPVFYYSPNPMYPPRWHAGESTHPVFFEQVVQGPPAWALPTAEGCFDTQIDVEDHYLWERESLPRSPTKSHRCTMASDRQVEPFNHDSRRPPQQSSIGVWPERPLLVGGRMCSRSRNRMRPLDMTGASENTSRGFGGNRGDWGCQSMERPVKGRPSAEARIGSFQAEWEDDENTRTLESDANTNLPTETVCRRDIDMSKRSLFRNNSARPDAGPPPNAPTAPASHRKGSSTPSGPKSVPPVPQQQQQQQEPGSWSQSRRWTSRETQERMAFQKLMLNLYHMGADKSPFIPQTPVELAAFRAEAVEAQTQSLFQQVSERLSKPQARTDGVSALLGGRKLKDQLSPFFAADSCFNEASSLSGRQNVDWPSLSELKEDGDRHGPRYWRHLPPPHLSVRLHKEEWRRAHPANGSIP